MRKFLALLCLVLVAPAAEAQSIPNYNIKARCWRLAMRPNVPTETIFDSCMVAEQVAYSELYHWWDHIASETRYRCMSNSGGSYANMQFCIDASDETSN